MGFLYTRQVVGDVLQNKCMYGGREAAAEPDCIGRRAACTT